MGEGRVRPRARAGSRRVVSEAGLRSRSPRHPRACRPHSPRLRARRPPARRRRSRSARARLNVPCEPGRPGAGGPPGQAVRSAPRRTPSPSRRAWSGWALARATHRGGIFLSTTCGTRPCPRAVRRPAGARHTGCADARRPNVGAGGRARKATPRRWLGATGEGTATRVPVCSAPSWHGAEGCDLCRDASPARPPNHPRGHAPW
jgi:hypothetical protein